MGCCQNVKLSCRKAKFLAISFVFLLTSSSTQVLFKVEGRATPVGFNSQGAVNEEEKILRAQIGSRPPRCERRCLSCGHCEAIQIPTNPTTFKSNAYAGGDVGSNYKPMNWKCKCGSLIFNP